VSGTPRGGRSSLARRIWRGESLAAALARAALLIPAAAYRAGVALRNAAYDLGLLRSRPLPAPSVGVGNIAVGGTGKTPVAAFLAGELARRGLRPGILLRGYGADESAEHAERARGAVVVADPDRHRGAARALREGADALVLDDCLQRRDVRTDLMLAVLAAESAGERRWPLPAGPWREGLGALRRCDAVVVTYKVAPPDEAAAAARRLAPRTRLGVGVAVGLKLARFLPLTGGAPLPAGALAGRDVVAVCGIGAPERFGAQLEALGARVRLFDYGDHHAYAASDVDAAVEAAGPNGLIVTTAKDAVKLRSLYRAQAPACVVAELEVRVTYGEPDLARLLDRALRPQSNPVTAATPPSVRQDP
jgi:tetraacyldisaccharide 4'-kinase